jgi:hypothetical protein
MMKNIAYSWIVLISLATFHQQVTGQFHFLYPNETYKKTALMTFLNGYGEVSNERISGGLNGRANLRIHNIISINGEISQCLPANSDLNRTATVWNKDLSISLLLGSDDLFKGGFYFGYNDGIRNKKVQKGLNMRSTETGLLYNNMRLTDPTDTDVSLAYTGQIPYYKAGFTMFSSNPDEGMLMEYHFYYCWTNLPQQSGYYNEINYFGVNIPASYIVEGLSHTKRGFGIIWNLYYLNALSFGVDVGFRPTHYVTALLDGKPLMESLFMNMKVGFRVF